MQHRANCFGSGIATVPGFARSRGVSYWTDGHDSRIFVPLRNFLFALDAATGKLIPTFGENGSIDLRKGLREPYQSSLSRSPRRERFTKT